MNNYNDAWRVWYYPDSVGVWYLADGSVYGQVSGPPYVVSKLGQQSAREEVGKIDRVVAGVRLSDNAWGAIPFGASGWFYLAGMAGQGSEWGRYNFETGRYGQSRTLSIYTYENGALRLVGRKGY